MEKKNVFDSSMFRKAVLALLLSFVLALSFSAMAEAGTMFTYNGKGIANKPSIKTYNLTSGKTCYVQHSQKISPGGFPNQIMKVSIQRKKIVTWTTVGSRTFKNNVSFQTFSAYCSSGKYRLYFSAAVNHRFDISGRFYS
ncbi:MAG: hypothetical protein FWG00_00205 [Coriobacteriia bacterium]|nr:hypothetical protein [Coriobacteriia bacterium]